MLVVGLVLAAPAAVAAQPPVGLGTATSYAVLAGSTVTNTGPSVISGDVGLYPGTAVTGFPPGTVINGTQHVTDAAADQAKADLRLAYNDAAGRIPATAVTSDLGGRTLTAGVYQASSAMALTGTLTLNGGPDDVFIFQAGSTLITASSAVVNLVGGASACNVFWQVGSSTTLGTNTTFVGTVMSLASATLNTGATVQGRVLARNGAVTLDDNTITAPDCRRIAPSSSPTATATVTVTATPTGGSSATATPSSTSTGSPTTTIAPTTSPGNGGGGTIPSGHPETGEGGAAGSPGSPASWLLLGGGGLALGGSVVAWTRGARRRHTPTHSGR